MVHSFALKMCCFEAVAAAAAEAAVAAAAAAWMNGSHQRICLQKPKFVCYNITKGYQVCNLKMQPRYLLLLVKINNS